MRREQSVSRYFLVVGLVKAVLSLIAYACSNVWTGFAPVSCFQGTGISFGKRGRLCFAGYVRN